MVLSYWLLQAPYTATWRLLKYMRRTIPAVFYCADLHDWVIFEPVQKHLRELPVVTSNAEVVRVMRSQGKKALRMPVFPDTVIMCRHACHKFPARAITRIGMRHGPYHFKRMTSAGNYNLFDLYLMTSAADVRSAETIGVTSATAVGYPKLDRAFNGALGERELAELRQRCHLDQRKKTLLFTATWPKSGMSAFSRWHDRLSELTTTFNVLVTLHPWIEERYRQVVASTPGVFLVEDDDAVPYIVLADVCIGDTSSILAECCALDKPLITWRTERAKRTLDEIEALLERISLRVKSFEQMLTAIDDCLANPDLKRRERQEASRLMFDELDGQAGKRAAEEIVRLVPELRP
ncbi:MAG: CDP-glycerol glycerophosphotransferase family protein [Candidatus Cloacimonetes bacterium]|nr:CDP-glycerol glycerophosphotransferase family protein [Candidatus Cloacimonadota bacterium]